MTLRIATQFSLFLINKPGVLAHVTSALAEAALNLTAMTLVDSQEHGVLRLVPEDPDAARTTLAKLALPMTETEVLCVELADRPGALAKVAALLAEHHVNVNYVYCTSGAPTAGTTTAIFKVADAKKAEQLLLGHP